MPKMKIGSHIKIAGVVAPKERDKRGNLIQVSIDTDRFERYIIADDAMGQELFDYLNADVEIEGRVVGEDIDGYKVISVMRYKLIRPHYVTN
ncbi:MAG: hypothetical protein ONB16_03450 [candidate division KSB1 bacterium]|nr:hypothetical protein [candidate division KSB1 bacterium]MDZ7318012.1 hypothetical protein [candidate division KSB1 bacterium]MDZ7341581.1 hypothetical protein [candidate division KSB1 bacterium]